MIERPRHFSDTALLERIQRQTFRYFWDYAHPVSGLSRERRQCGSARELRIVTSGGSGFGVMAIVVAVERGWVTRREAVTHLLNTIGFLERAERHHGVFPHWLDGATGRTFAFSPKDDGGDLVETAFLIAGLLSARQYFRRPDGREAELRAGIDRLWGQVEWDWHMRQGGDGLFWHWSPNHGWAMNHPIRGWNECLVAYVLAAASPTHPVAADAYHLGWANGPAFANGRRYHGIELPLGPERGGPLFFAHYSFLGLDPHGLSDGYADYWRQNTAHALVNRAHCIENPNDHQGYGAACWGLTASDNHQGYSAHAPDNDLGVITPTAALASMPYVPEHAMEALHHFYHRLGGRLWGDFGFRDAFCEGRGWVADSYLAIDQGPIIVMIENHLSGLVWELFMSCPEIRDGLGRLGLRSRHCAARGVA